jgi:hypothetical protein
MTSKLPTFGITCESECYRQATQYVARERSTLSGKTGLLEYSALCNVHAAARRRRTWDRSEPVPLTPEVVTILRERQADQQRRRDDHRRDVAEQRRAHRQAEADRLWETLEAEYEMTLVIDSTAYPRHDGSSEERHDVTLYVHPMGSDYRAWASIPVELRDDELAPAHVRVRAPSPTTLERWQLVQLSAALTIVQRWADELNADGAQR